MAPQDRDYRAFITQLHRADGSRPAARPRWSAASDPVSTPRALVVVALLAIAIAGLLVRALATGEFAGALFLVGFAALFGWQIGGFIRRNRPRSYTFDRSAGSAAAVVFARNQAQ